MRESRKRRCVFCGKERIYFYEEGHDEIDYSTARSRYIEPVERDNGCDCILGKLEYEKQALNPMCLNCTHYEYGYCTCKEEIASISEMFEVNDKVHVKSPEKKCNHWEINRKIIDRLIILEQED